MYSNLQSRKLKDKCELCVEVYQHIGEIATFSIKSTSDAVKSCTAAFRDVIGKKTESQGLITISWFYNK